MLVAVLNLIAGMCIGFSTGANDAANAMGTAVGAGVRSIRQAVLLVAGFGLLGAILQGSRVIGTVGNGIVPLALMESNTARIVVLSAFLASGLWVTSTTYLGLPTSTSHSLIGAMAGAGLAMGTVPVYWSKLLTVIVAWVMTPLGAGLLAFFFGKILQFSRGRERKFVKLWAWLLTCSGIYMAYSWGANDVANATGPIVGTGMLNQLEATMVGGIAIAAGVLLWGHKVMSTVGSELTPLIPSMAFAAELASAINVHIYATLGLPVSTSHAIVGGVIGVGLSRGKKAVDRRTVVRIVTIWFATPFVCMSLGYILFKILQ